MTLSDILTGLVEYVNDDTLQDALMIPAVRRAIRWAERNHTFKYMEGFATITLTPPAAGATPAIVTLSTAVKCILDDDGRVYHASNPQARGRFRQVSYDDFLSFVVGPPKTFHVVGLTGIRVCQIVPVTYMAEIPVALYTTWPNGMDEETTHWLFDAGEDFVTYKAATYVAAALRDTELRMAANLDADTALKTLLDADEEMRQGARLEVIGYADSDLEDDLPAGTSELGPIPPEGPDYWSDGSWWSDGSAWSDGSD